MNLDYNPYTVLSTQESLEQSPVSPAIRVVQYATISALNAAIAIGTCMYYEDVHTVSIIAALFAASTAAMSAITALEYTVINTNLLAQGQIDRQSQQKICL